MQALVPVLLYIGLVIGAQAFNVNARRYAPAIVLAFLPNIAAVGHRARSTTLSAAAGTTAQKVGDSALASNGVIYNGLLLLGQGAVLVGIVLGAIACFVHRQADVRGRDHRRRSAPSCRSSV